MTKKTDTLIAELKPHVTKLKRLEVRGSKIDAEQNVERYAIGQILNKAAAQGRLNFKVIAEGTGLNDTTLRKYRDTAARISPDQFDPTKAWKETEQQNKPRPKSRRKLPKPSDIEKVLNGDLTDEQKAWKSLGFLLEYRQKCLSRAKSAIKKATEANEALLDLNIPISFITVIEPSNIEMDQVNAYLDKYDSTIDELNRKSKRR